MERRQFTREFKLEAVRLIKERGVSYAQASEDLGVHPTQLRNWVKQLADDPQHAVPGQGQMKPEQLEIAQLKREVLRLKAERDILKNYPGPWACLRGVETALCYPLRLGG
jgi:transposase-like protein